MNDMLEKPDDFVKNIQRYTVSIASTVLYGWRTATSDKGYVKDLIEVRNLRAVCQWAAKI